ncbi:MetQ/NlpA family ABC transporter substrate-binding protein [Aquibacillus sediminis]|uniref:MetQ/NlpA family ABC transporter substrate-binding protein n=1 Tax=Aquibacillus sediminis TaxID=2574734 RepID=UPI001109585E|nr:MetQ/NlpA family ABC transporter substrate-binding protein [Aquibacillus sediminis]
MKKWLVLIAALFIVVLAACGTANEETETDENNNTSESEAPADENTEGSSEGEELTEILVGATSTPHAEVLEEAKPLLEEEGISLTIEPYQEFVLPNQDLEDERIDANYFQHIPFFESEVEEKGYDLVNLGDIHIEPMGVYSQNIENIDDIPEGTEVLISRNVPDHGRILALFESQGLIKLDEEVDKQTATTDDIVENPLNLTFHPDFDPAFIIEGYEKEEDALVAINTNYALEADLTPVNDALFYEGDDSVYFNIVAARAEDKDNEALNTLVEVLQSEEIQTFISETYNGAVVPVGGVE